MSVWSFGVVVVVVVGGGGGGGGGGVFLSNFHCTPLLFTEFLPRYGRTSGH